MLSGYGKSGKREARPGKSVVHDTNMAVRTAVDAVRNLIRCDKEKE